MGMRAGPLGVALGAAVAVAIAPSSAQIPTSAEMRATDLPGPAPSAVVRHPPPPTRSGRVTEPLVVADTSPSPWAALQELEEELRRREDDLARCRSRLEAARADLEIARDYLLRLEEARDRLRREVHRRIVLLDRIGRGGVARLVLTSRDPGEARFRARLVRRLVREDAELASRYAEMGEQAEAIRRDVTRKVATQEALARRLEQRQRELEAEVERHRTLVRALEDPGAATGLRAEADIEVDSIAEALALSPRARARTEDGGRVAAATVAVPATLPVAADPLHGGFAVGAPPGLPVISPADGVVAFVGLLAAWGPSILIRTYAGDGVLLGHISDPTVRAGDVVKVGSIVGSTSRSYSSLLPPLLVGTFGDAARVL